MSVIDKVLRMAFGKRKEKNTLEIVFHKDANPYGTHGTIRASHRAHRLENASVRFAFVGISVPPALTPEIFKYIWESARAAGYMPVDLMTYGRVIEVDSVGSAQYLVSPERRRIESMHSIANPIQ